MPKDLNEIHRNSPTREIAEAVTAAENPREQLDELFSSYEIYHMLPGEGNSHLSHKSRRIEALVRICADMTNDYRHFDTEPQHTNF